MVFPGSVEEGVELVNTAITFNNAQAIVVVTKQPAGDGYRKSWDRFFIPVFFVNRATLDDQGGIQSFLVENFKSKAVQNAIFVIDMNIDRTGTGSQKKSRENEFDWATKSGSEWALAFRSVYEVGKIGTIAQSIGYIPSSRVIKKIKGKIDYSIVISPKANRDELNKLSEYLQPNGLLEISFKDDYYRHGGGMGENRGAGIQGNAQVNYGWIELEATRSGSSASQQPGTLNSLNNYTVSSSNITGAAMGGGGATASQYLKGIVGNVITGDPTFVQPNPARAGKKHSQKTSNDLVAKISVPMDHSLVRGHVPIFGLAYGKDFEEYRLEYCEGMNPTEWVLIKKSSDSQDKDTAPKDLDDSADITIHGNLATWDTGLKSYVYLPDFPPDHPVDLCGVYTLRLVVSNSKGDEVEDRVTVEVGEAIPNALGGTVRSKDKKVALVIPEQSLMDCFRVISIKQADTAGSNLPEGKTLLSGVYEFREPGDVFTKGALLEFDLPQEALKNNGKGRASIYGYDASKKKWIRMQSSVDAGETKIRAEVKTLLSIYTVMIDEGDTARTETAPSPESSTEKQLPAAEGNVETSGFYLVRDLFEKDTGGWSNRDGSVGAQVSRDNKATYDDSFGLKLSGPEGRGNFACNVYGNPFDARSYPRVKFDYRISPEVKISFYVKVENKWYEIGLTGTPNDFKNKRVNITSIGRIRDVLADDKWHTAEFDLFDMLRSRTRNTVVTEIIMADWDVTGYMKLNFGSNKKGPVFYIDNFSISRNLSSPADIADELIIDNFNKKNNFNALGGRQDVFVDSPGSMVQSAYVEGRGEGGKKDHALKLTYSLKKEGGFAGYLMPLQKVSLRDFSVLSLYIRGAKGDEKLRVGLKDASGNESRVNVNDFLRKGVEIGWKKVSIPLVAFGDIKDWSSMDSLSFSVDAGMGQIEEMVYIDDVKMEKKPASVFIDDFQKYDDMNLLGGNSWIFLNESAAIHGAYKGKDPDNRFYSISYGGNIGDLFTYCGWATQLKGLDVSGCEAFRLRIQGADGGEEPMLYLDDGTDRWGMKVSSYKPVTTSWQEVTIPLADFAMYGVDLTHVDEIQLVFEWKRMSGTVSIDDIEFIGAGQK